MGTSSPMACNIVLHRGNTYLLEPVQEPFPQWHIRPGTFRVAQPYDQSPAHSPSLESTPETPSVSNPLEATSDILTQQPSPTAHSLTLTHRNKRKRLNKTSPADLADTDQDIAQWIQSELKSLLYTDSYQSWVQSMQHDYFYGSYVYAPASEAFAVDFVGLQPMLQMLSAGFTSTSAHESEGNEAVVFKKTLLEGGQQLCSLDLADMYETLVLNEHTEPCIVSLAAEGLPRYLIPPHSGFIAADLGRIDGLKAMARSKGGFDIIVMDPPWQNASVDRMSHYGTMDLYDLFKIPVKDLLRTKRRAGTEDEQQQYGEIVAVWVTNRAKVKKVVVDKLFPSWGLELVAHWYWLKVTTKGVPVLSLQNKHRRAYEGIIIGRRISQKKPASEQNSSSATPGGIERRILVSVPSQHSRKPSVFRILESEFFPKSDATANDKVSPSDVVEDVKDPDPDQVSKQACKASVTLNRLELFARNLEEGVISWGNEPMRYQYCGRGSESTGLVQDGFLVPSPSRA
ncbi:Methyltransferase-like protein 4 [Mortierella alpina]|uniref:Methyltransferase-like protein 4 n=1 Tax=Mortierella alpina TaxID=64518 RepID=A0A9P6JET1_MORAP|nr:Methyltransferase-like protein 4 [Mortierella alpina]